ncbi:MAG: CBS domain-containing protein [Roseomonas sp.]|jgi:CBS domain-containing protein|nr:CBS domain-containing protein [Roseomonas sp.]MCZ8142104.1 CBS domain-containing protein [Acetobacteraceae bacterium]MCA3406904.1 CBS domain-containing protein [Roseomonas sp.]MCA3420587.1 CBS domain-containing protein [Roseomonas sp.]MCA3422485.1 CBS domain-containing protein [Roseomonas sp.]
MTIAAVLRQKGNAAISVTPETPVVEIARIMAARRIGAVLIVTASGQVAGILSERDIVKAVADRRNGVRCLAAEEIMTREVIMVGADTPVEAALEIMDQGYFRHLPVCDSDGSLLGIVSIRDLVKFRFAKQEHDVEALKAYVTRSFMH